MVKDESNSAAEPTRIAFTDASQPDQSSAAEPEMANPDPVFDQPGPHEDPAGSTNAPAIFSSPEETEPSAELEAPGGSPAASPSAFEPIQPEVVPEQITPSPAPTPEPDQPHIEGLRFNQPKSDRRWLKFSIIAIVVLLIAAYLAIDSGAIGSGINLPFHIFKQKNNSPASTAGSTNKPAASSSVPAVPAGFKVYKLAGTQLTFAAPAAWGDPTSSSESGFSKRSTGAQSDGTYAYIVDFASNKDIEIAVTSDKYLPPARAVLYYDFLQWCTGTNDGKFYESLLQFTTANKVDTPTTVTCDQGPLASAQKLNATTLLQTKVPNTAGKVIGDIYVKNLTDNSNLPVIRVKDAAMTNGDDIKQLLNTVKVTPVSTSNSSSQ
jgi:hypothetical protein